MIVPTPCILDENVTLSLGTGNREPSLRKDTCQKMKDEKNDRFQSLKKQRRRTKFEQKGHCQKLIANKG